VEGDQVTRKPVIGALLGIVLALLVAAPVGAQGYGDVITVTPGETITVSGSGCGAHDEVVIALDGETLTVVTADADGNFTARVTIPLDTSLGFHTLTASCSNGVVLTLTLNVVASGTLPTTGSSDSTGTIVGIGAALIVLGSAAVYGARQRRRQTVSA
jgi:LPXTG-motif cell wall-anchored protein